MKNIIYINGIEVYAYHGVFSEENILGQRFIFDVSCHLNYMEAMLNDSLDSSVSYADIISLIVEVATSTKYNLLEKLSYEIIKEIFSKYELIYKVNVRISKPNAPIDKIFSSCGTDIEISREEFENLK